MVRPAGLAPPGCRPTPWYLHPDGRLATSAPPSSEPDHYRYDPNDPTPAVGGAMENLDRKAGAKDNRGLEARPDILTYTTDPLATDIDMIGPVTASIVIRSSQPHTDLCARLCNVAPDGRSTNLADGNRRLRPDDPPAHADGTRTIALDLIAVAHRFRTGHRIR